MADQPLRIGVLALQGSFREHMTCLSKVPGVEAVEVRTKEELSSVAGLIIPGEGGGAGQGRAGQAEGRAQSCRALAGRAVAGTRAGEPGRRAAQSKLSRLRSGGKRRNPRAR